MVTNCKGYYIDVRAGPRADLWSTVCVHRRVLEALHSRSSGSRGRGRLEEAVWDDARLLFGSVDHPWLKR